MIKRRRADQLLVERGLAESRAKAQAMVLAGEVFSGTTRIDKAGTQLTLDAELRVAERQRFVSRGGEKLERAFADFAPAFDSLVGRTAIDIGASTGGFTDCLLQRGAERVIAVDVGYGQLDQRLRDHPRVTVRDRTNARELDRSQFDEIIDLIVVDASFIGLGVLLPAIVRTLATGGALVALIKPQFEAGREAVSRGKGVVRDPAVRGAAIAKVVDDIQSRGLTIVRQADCRVSGPKGNVEHFVYARVPE